MAKLINVIRWVVFIPFVIIVFYLIDLGLELLIYKMLQLSTFWLLIIGLVFPAVVVGLFSMFTAVLTAPIIMLVPNKRIGGVIFSIVASIFGIGCLIGYWGIDISLMGKIILEIEILWLWASLVYFGIDLYLDEK